ncbi:unnamed protein product, partial [Symbiodinium pilosum]
IKKLAEKAFPSSSQRSYLFEAWITSSESWKNSKLLVALKSRSKHARRGLRRWYTFDEMVKRWGTDIAEDIKNTKLGDEKLKEREDMVQYLCLADDTEEQEDAEELEKIIQFEDSGSEN